MRGAFETLENFFVWRLSEEKILASEIKSLRHLIIRPSCSSSSPSSADASRNAQEKALQRCQNFWVSESEKRDLKSPREHLARASQLSGRLAAAVVVVVKQKCRMDRAVLSTWRTKIRNRAKSLASRNSESADVPSQNSAARIACTACLHDCWHFSLRS